MRVNFPFCVVLGLPPNDRLVNQGFDLFLGGGSVFVCSKKDTGDLAQLVTHPRQRQAPTFFNFFELLFQGQEELFQWQWKGQCIATGTEAVPCHVSYGIQGAFSGAILRFHGHAGEGGDARTRTDGFHHRHLFLQKTFGRIARPHLIG